MNYSKMVLDNYDLLGYDNINREELELILNLWREGCPNTHTPAQNVENQDKNTRLSLVK